MTLQLDPQVGAAHTALAAQSGPKPAPGPVENINRRRDAFNSMLEHAYNVAQPIAADVEITEHEVTAAHGTALRARWYQLPTSDSDAAVLHLHGGGMILGSVPIFDGTVSRYVAETGVPMQSLHYRLAREHLHRTRPKFTTRTRACVG